MPRRLLEAYESLFKSLWDRMSVMLGRFGTHSLMERALFDTSKENHLAADIVLRDDGLDFSTLEQVGHALDRDQLRDAVNRLVVNLVGVLAEQVGRTMAERIAGRGVVPGEEQRD